MTEKSRPIIRTEDEPIVVDVVVGEDSVTALEVGDMLVFGALSKQELRGRFTEDLPTDPDN